MTCQRCPEEESVHLTEAIDGRVRELHLCGACARKAGLPVPSQPPELALEHFLHVGHGVVVAAGAGQLDRRGALGVEVLRVVAGPDQRGVEGRFIGPEVLGDAVGTLGDGRVLGFCAWST